MYVNGKKLLVVGDRVLISPESGATKTRLGLYLPAAAVEKLAVQSGSVVDVGPGTPVASPVDVNEEPWKPAESQSKVHYIPIEAKVGDFALFLRNAAVEIEFEGTKYLIVPHAAILLLVREEEKAAEESAAEFDDQDFKF